MRSTLVRLSLLVCSLFCSSVAGLAQYDYLPKVGIKDFASYQQSSIDSVDLDTGNVNLHIPLIGFPQKGNKLRLNFIVRYNEPQWLSVIGMPQYNPTIEGYSAAGFWKLKNFNNPRPLGVDVVRDQAVTSTYDMTSRIAPGCCGNGDPVDYYSEASGIRDRSGAEHTLSVWAGAVGAPRVNFPAPDASGWVVTSGGLKDKDGVTYNSFTVHQGSASRPAWNISDAHGNTITTDVDGWHDSMDRVIPGSWDGQGAGASSLNGSVPLEDDPFPGVPSSEMARCNNGAVATRTWIVPASSDSGGSQTYYFCFSKYTAHTHYNFNGRLGQVNSAVLDEASFDAYLLTKIILPNDTSYSFQYDPDFLDLTRIDLPTGGVIVYSWGTVKWDNCSTALPMKRVVTARSVTTGGGVSSWNYTWGNGGVCNPQPGDAIPVIVSRPDQNDEWHYQTRMEDNGKLNKYVVFYKGHAGGDAYKATGTISKIAKTSSSFRQTPLFTQTQDILVSPETGPDGNPLVKWLPGYSTPETIPGPVEKTIETLYDTATQSVVSSQETDATPVPSSGSIERWNPDNYWYPAHDTCACVNYSEIKSEQVYDFVQGSGSGPGTLLRETDTTYRFQDTGGADYENNGLTGLPSQVKVYDGSSHQVAQTRYTYDEATYSAGLIAGELTSVRKWKDASNYYDTHSSFNSDGTWTESVDANGIKTHANSFDCSSVFPKSVTKAYGTSIAETFVYSHDCNTGKVVSYVDANSRTTSYTYNDSLNRVTAVDYPDGGHTGISYTDGTNSSTTVEVSTGGPQGKMSQTVNYDLVGRTINVQQNAGSDVINVDTYYDAMGHVYSTSNPYAGTRGSSIDATLNDYDELERLIKKTNPDNTYQTFSYAGNVVTTKDEVSNSWKRTSDALGRLTKVVEPNNATTSYNYTARGDLATVTQTGLSGDIARTRSFDYDWLSRLTQSFNPESGWICYGTTSGGAANGANCTADYDGNGNLGHKTNARGVVSSYTYDVLDRLNDITYSDGTPGRHWRYDFTPGWGGTFSGNNVGRLSQVSTDAVNGQSTMKVLNYDAMGRVKFASEAAPRETGIGTFHTTSADYDLAGNVIGITYPDGRKVAQGYDNAGRTTSVSYASWNTTSKSYSYLTVPSAGYDPAGHLINATFGNGELVEANYDKRQRVHWLAYGTTPQLLWGKQYKWTSNSNLDTTTDMLTGVQRQFGYDSLSRLTSAQDFVGPSTGINLSPLGSGSATPTTNSSTVVTAPTAWTDPNDSNMLINPDAPTGPGWEHNASVSIEYGHLAPDGTTTAYGVTGTSSDSYITASANSGDLYDGETMTGSIWLRSPSGPKTIDLFLEELGPTLNGRAAKTVTVTQQWQQFQLSGIYQYGYQYVLFQVGGVSTLQQGQTIEAWGAKLEDTGTAGRTVTNFARYSQQITSTWGLRAVSVANSSATAPDGTQSAATVTANSNSGDSWIVNMVPNPSPLSGLPITGSVWLRAPNGTQTISLCLISDGATNSSSVNVTITTAWQRFQVTSNGMSTSGMLQLQIGGGNTFTSGQSIQVWGAQVELAQSAGPYVPTGLDPVSIGTNLTNILSYSQDPTGPSWTATTGVTTAPNSVVAPDGSRTAAEMTATSNDSYAVNDALNPALYNSQLVTGSVFLRSPSGSRNVSVCVFGDTASSRASQCMTASLTTTWKRFNVSVQLPNALARVAMQIGGGNSFASGQVVDVWGTQIELNSRAGTYVHTGSLPIIKGQEPENLLSSSQLDDGPGWSYPDGTHTGSATGPDGKYSAAVVTANSGNSDCIVVNSVANPSLYDQQTVTASVYLRVPSGSLNTSIHIINVGENNWTSPGELPVTLTTTWQRFSVTATNQNGLTQLSLQIGGGNTITSGQEIQIWGAQMVVGSYAGVYSETTSWTPSSSTGQWGSLVYNGMNRTYSYDAFGNLLQNGSFSATYNARNEMNNFAYDPTGNLLSNGVATMNWDAENRISSAAGAIYTYDADGNRVESVGVGLTDTVYFGGRPIARYTNGQWTDLIYGPNGLIAEVAGTEAAAPQYRFTDHLGTLVGTSGANGVIGDILDYYPFGETFSGSTSDRFLFTGKERDAESGLDYFGARYYGSTMGRFMSPDWSVKAEPVPYAKLGNPQTLNLYAYAGNNPVSVGDVTGHSPGPLFPILNEGDIMMGEVALYQQQLQNDMHNSGAAQQSGCNADACATAKAPWLSRVGGWFSRKVGAAGIAFARFGRLGGPAHRAAIGRISRILEEDGYSVTQEKYIPTENGAKGYRFADVYGKNNSTGEIRMYQVGRTNANGTPVSREVQAMDDIQGATGIRPQFIDYNNPVITGEMPVMPMGEIVEPEIPEIPEIP